MKLIQSIILTIIVGIFSGQAFAANGSQRLHLVYPQKSALKNPVIVKIQLKQDKLLVFFKILTPQIYATKKLAAGHYPYEYDVVEIFLSAKKNKDNLPIPYYEFELSPYNQSFQAKIISMPNKVINNINTGMEHSTHIIPDGWIAEMSIPLKNLNWQGDPCEITGNIFAILGKQPRAFWSLYLPQQSQPSFHKPEYFKKLVCFQKNGLR